MVVYHYVGIAGGIVAMVVASVQDVRTLHTSLKSLGAIRDRQIAEVVGRYRIVITMIQLIRPLYLPIARQQEHLKLVVKRLQRSCHRLTAIAIGRFFFDRQSTSGFHRESQSGSAIAGILATQHIANQQIVAAPRVTATNRNTELSPED